MKHIQTNNYDLYNDDCMEVMQSIPDNSIDLVLMDKPYGIQFRSNARNDKTVVTYDAIKKDVFGDKKQSIKSFNSFDYISNDDVTSWEFLYKELYRIMKDNTAIVSFCSYKNYNVDYTELSKYFTIKNAIIWNKGGGGMGDLENAFATDYEIAIVAHKGLRKLNGKRIGSIWKFNGVNGSDMIHPTEKPSNLLKRFIEYFSNKGDVVLDPFAGSFSCGEAAIEMQRKFIGIEIDEEYFKNGIERMKNASSNLNELF